MWETIQISGRLAEVFRPGDGPLDAALIYLHGYAGESLAEHPEFTALFERFRLPVVRPSGGQSWWLDMPSQDFPAGTSPMQFVSEDVTGWIQETWGISPPQIGLLGVSMGGQGALNLAYRQALRFPVVAAITPAIDFHLLHGRGYSVENLFPDAEAARQETAILHLHPLNWPKHQFFCCDPADRLWLEGCERLASKLSSSGVPFTSDLKTSHGGHGWPYFNKMAEQAVTFLAAGLRSSAT